MLFIAARAVLKKTLMYCHSHHLERAYYGPKLSSPPPPRRPLPIQHHAYPKIFEKLYAFPKARPSIVFIENPNQVCVWIMIAIFSTRATAPTTSNIIIIIIMYNIINIPIRITPHNNHWQNIYHPSPYYLPFLQSGVNVASCTIIMNGVNSK